MTLIVLNAGHKPTDDRDFVGPETEGGNNAKTVALMKQHLEANYICEVVLVSQPTTDFSKLGSTYPNATLFYSRHSNAYNTKARGVEVFYTYGKTLAQNIAKATAAILNTTVRGTKEEAGAKRNSEAFGGAGFAVLNQAEKAGVKYAFLAEIGFHDNPTEAKRMVEKRKELAIAEAEEIAKYLKLERKPQPVASTTKFRVVAGTFANRKNAEALQTKLKAAGFSSFLVAFEDK